MISVVVLQARTSSTRLPAKVLLPICGWPVAVLAAKRAANTGRHVIVATSTDSSDDGLARILELHRIPCFRGSLDDTLGRFVETLVSYPDETIVFRLTADNVFPDGSLLDEIETQFTAGDLQYLACNGEPSGLPYGVSAEVTRLAHLREANAIARPGPDREHVTPAVIRKFGRRYFEKYRRLERGALRSTIDVLDDYLRVEGVFRGVTDPIAVSALHLTERLAAAQPEVIARRPVTRLVVGTAQFGSSYGITNVTGPPTLAECRSLVRTAIENGVSYIDTARDYGSSEAVLGSCLDNGLATRATVITKLSPLRHCPADANAATVGAFVEASVFGSCSALRRHSIDVLLLHRVAHLDAWSGSAWRHLLELRDAGTVRRLGASVQSPEELVRALAEDDITFVQMPFNVLDARWDAVAPRIEEARRSRGVTLHVRSTFLQGLLLSNDAKLWKRANCDADIPARWVQRWAQELQCESIADFCLAYVRSQPWVDGVVVGAETRSQLVENLRLFERPEFAPEVVAAIEASRPTLPEEVLNPARWRHA